MHAIGPFLRARAFHIGAAFNRVQIECVHGCMHAWLCAWVRFQVNRVQFCPRAGVRVRAGVRECVHA